ncbi:hypothetical protein PENSPDRAFT_247535 [Peniophora sp. CONT]|nr:hypothetical protein PENSPDRAFT_247535 [Peniophora sp. CONT]
MYLNFLYALVPLWHMYGARATGRLLSRQSNSARTSRTPALPRFRPDRHDSSISACLPTFAYSCPALCRVFRVLSLPAFPLHTQPRTTTRMLAGSRATQLGAHIRDCSRRVFPTNLSPRRPRSLTRSQALA